MTTLRQIQANRRNSTQSTGPKTDEGKAQSRRNATQHGLAAKVVVPQQYSEILEKRIAAWSESLHPQDEFQGYHLTQAVVASLRVEHCQASEVERRIELAAIATDPSQDWDLDRQSEANCLGDSLKRNPPRVAFDLRRTPAGRDWLIAQWLHLLNAVPERGRSFWTPTQTEAALDLLGFARTLREALTTLQEEFLDPTLVRAFILAEIDFLRSQQVDAPALNAETRALHALGLSLEHDARLKLLRRYEVEATRLLAVSKKAFDTSKAEAKKAEAAPKVAPTVTKVDPKPTAQPAPTIRPHQPHSQPEATAPITPKAPAELIIKGNRRQRRKVDAAVLKAAHMAKARKSV